MTAKKHVQQAMAKARALGLECCLEKGKTGHRKLIATKDGVTLDVPISCSPTNADACVNMVIQMLRRRFLERGIEL